MSDAKHPISEGRDDRDSLCWREHLPGHLCVLPEGHPAGTVAATPEAFYQACVDRSMRMCELALAESGKPPLTDSERVRVELGVACGITSTFGELQESGAIGFAP